MADHVRSPSSVRVVYALADRQYVVDTPWTAGLTVQEAVERSGLLTQFEAAFRAPLACAVFGRPVLLDRQVAPGERIEILRPLLIDPKEKRRRTAARARSNPR